METLKPDPRRPCQKDWKNLQIEDFKRHDCSIYTDHRITRRKRVHTLYTHSTGQWSHWGDLEEALERALEDGSTRILFCGTDNSYLFQFIRKDKPKDPP